MTTGIGARSNQDRDIQVVAVTAVNIPERKAECMTRIRSMIYVDTSYPVGGVYITPSVGDQWYVERIDTIWRLFGRIPFNDNNIQVDPVEGQQVFGGTGPVVMNGSTLDIRSPLQMNPVPDDEMPNAADMPPGTIIYSESLGLVVSDGTGEWVPTGGAGDIEDIEGLTELLDNKIDKPLVPLVPGVGTKISYDENGLVIGSEDAGITDITDLDTTLDGKSDVGHIHDETEITNLVTDLAGKAAVDHVHSEDGEALDPDLIDIGALTPANFDFIQRIADHWTNVPPSEVKGGLDLSFLDIGGICDLLQIPSLPANWITSGTFLTGLIPQIDVTKIIGGPFTIDMIPKLATNWITGIFSPTQIPSLTPGHIPDLSADKITSGILDLLHIPAMDLGRIPSLPASQITSGVLNLLRIPGLDLTRIPELPAGQITSGTFLDTLIPNLAASKITSGVLNLLRIPGLDLSRIPELPAGQITSGTFPQSMLDILNIPAGIISGILGGTNIPQLDVTKIIGGPFTIDMIPGLPAGQITSGTFPQSMLDILNIPAGIISGILGGTQIPQLDVTKIIGGPFTVDMIPGLPAGQITSGTFPQSMLDILNIPAGIISGILGGTHIPQLDVTKIIGGPFDLGMIPGLPAGQITSGTFPQSMLDILNIPAGIISGILGGAHIPQLDVTKIIGGPFDTGMIPGLPADQITSGTFPQAMLDITNIPASIVNGLLGLTNIPPLPAGRITSGTFPQSMLDITSIASSIVSGSFLSSQIPLLDVTKIIGGPFTTDMIPSLNADKITAGVLNLLRIPGLDVGRIPNLPAGQITSGTFPQAMLDITNIASSIVSGSFLSSQIPLLDVTKIIGGPFDTGMIPGLPAGKITSGTFFASLIPNITLGMSSDMQAMIDAAYAAMHSFEGLETLHFDPNTGYGGGYSVGCEYEFVADGTVEGVSIWVEDTLTGTQLDGYTVRVYSDTGTILATQTATVEPVGGWFDIYFDTPADVVSGTPYMVVVHTTNNRWYDVWSISGHSSSFFTTDTYHLKNTPPYSYYASGVAFPSIGDANQVVCATPIFKMGGDVLGNPLSSFKESLENIPGFNIISNLPSFVIPGLDATQIISGQFAQSMITGLDDALAAGGQALIDAVCNAMGIPGTGHTAAEAKTALLNIPGVNIVSQILAGIVPQIDVTKIIGGPFTIDMIPSLNADKITAGVLNLLRIPGLDVSRIPNLPAGQITSGTFPQAMLDITNIASSIVSGSFLASQIPSLDVTKIIGGPFTAGMIPDLSASKITAGVLDLLRIPGLDVSRIPNLPAGQITSGTFPQSMLTITSIASSIVSGSFLASQIPSLDVTKIIGGPFTAGMIPDLNADKITQGVLNLLRIPGLDVGRIPSLPAGQITSGTFLGGLIPQLDVTKIIGGPFDTGMIPGLPASQITSGTFGAGLIPILDAATKLSGILGLGQIPELPADQITSGVLGTSLIPGLPADRITSGFLDLLRIPDLSADKITSGIFPQSMLGITNIAADLISGIIGLTQIPDLNASKITGGEFNPLRIPGLPASKIDSGVFGLGRIPLLDLTKIPLLDLTKIPNLPANWITGTFVTGQIPDLSADKITSGIMDLFRLPTFPTTKISGTFPQTMIDNLTTNLGSIFTTITSPTRADLLQNVPLGSIGQFNPELLTNPNYTNALSVFGGSTNWSWDPAVTRTVGGTGSAKVVADGVNSQLLSDPPIPVSPNQVLSVSHWLRWSGVTVIPGVAFRLSVTAYLGIGVSNTVDIQTIVTPAASSGWVQLSGQYTVPATGVDNIRLQLSVTSLVTAGQIWWDDGSVKKVQLLRQDWTSALVGDLNNLFTGIGARLLITDHTDLLTSLGLGTPTLTAITDRLANLGSGGLFNAANLANIIGIPMVSNTRVSGVGGAANIGTSMQETWNAVGGTALASLGDITSRLANLGSGGLFNASGLSNLLGIPTGKLPNAIIPALDGTLIQFGQVPIAQIPTNLFSRSNITDLQGVIDGLTNQIGFLNTAITGGSQANANKSLKSIFSTLLQTGQSTQRVLQEVQGDKYSGMSGFFNFGGVPSNASGLPSEIVTTYNGAGTSKLVVANGAAHWDLVPNGNRSAICRYSPRPTVTDGQFVGVTLPTYPGYGGGVSAANYTFARLNSTGTDFVYLKVTADAAMNYFAELGYAVGGSRTIWVPATLFQTDANVWLAAGTDGGLRQYQVLIGNTPLITYNEVGTASAMDANHRWWGFGGDVVGSGTVAPGDVNYISIADHRRPSIATNGFGVGSFFRIYRANTGLVNRSNGYNPLPSNFFDTVEQITPDFVFNSLTGELTIGYEGTYFVNMRFVINFMPDNSRTDALLYQNGVLVRRGFGTFSEAGGLAGANQPTGMGGGFVVYCRAGDVLRSGVYCSTTMNNFLNGNPSGNDCYWEVGLLNRSLA